MKEDVVSQTIERIIAIMNEEEAKKGGIEFILLENTDECKGLKAKLRLHIQHKGAQSSRIVSDCLSLDDIPKIHEAMEKFCKTKQIAYRTKE